MCKAPKPPVPKEPKKPEFLRNRYLDEFVGEGSAVKSLKAGRSSLRIPLSGPDTVVSDSPNADSGIIPIAPRIRARDPNVNRLIPGGSNRRVLQR